MNMHLHPHFYHLLRMKNNSFICVNKSLGQPTQRQSQVALSAATANIDNEQTDEQIMEREKSKNNNQNNPIYNKGDKFFVHYTHEQRFQSLKRDVHTLHQHMFHNSPAIYSKLIVGNRNRRNTQHELVRKRPRKALLQNQKLKVSINYQY